MQSSQDRLKVLFLPAWYPSEVNPAAGAFVREHAKAASLYNDIIVLYAYLDPAPQPKGPYRVSDEIEERVRTIRVRYGGIILYLWRKFAGWKQKRAFSLSSRAKPAVYLGKLLAIPAVIAGDLLYYWSVFAAFRKLVKKGWRPDIIHAHVFTAGVPAIILGKLYRIPVVITEHWSGFPLRKLTFFDQTKARFSMNRAQIVLPVSDDLRRHIETYGVKNRFKIVPNVVDTEVFQPVSPSNKETGNNRKKKLLLVSLLTSSKGIPYLLEALSQIKRRRQDFVLDIVGDGANRHEYEELAKDLGLENMVNFHGFKPKEEVAQYMRNCDFYVQPSLCETFGVVYIEAMACGKPVIGTNLPVLREFIDEKVGLLVPPKDVKILRQAIEYMLDNYQNYSPKEIAQHCGERFSCKAVGRILDKVYRVVLQERRK